MFLSAEVLRGKWKAISFGMIPGYAWHTAFGVLGVWLIMKAVA